MFVFIKKPLPYRNYVFSLTPLILNSIMSAVKEIFSLKMNVYFINERTKSWQHHFLFPVGSIIPSPTSLPARGTRGHSAG